MAKSSKPVSAPARALPPFQLGRLPLLARVGITSLLLVLGLGLWASFQHLEHHHENRDGEAGLSIVDVEGAYHGIDQPSRLVRALEGGHAEELAEADRELLLAWLRGDRVSEDYDSLELGDLAPAEVLDASCLECHARGAAEPAEPPLEYWDDVKAVAFSRRLEATPEEILVVSTHTHALSLGVLVLALGLLTFATRFSARVCSLPLAVAGPGLLLDFAGWWLARAHASWVLAILAGGALFVLGTLLAIGLLLAEMWLPRTSE